MLQRIAALGFVAGGAEYDLGQCCDWLHRQNISMWQHVSTAPFDRDLELAVIDNDGQHVLVFPCRRISNGWIKVDTKERLDVRPTHWREWGTADAGAGNPLTSKQSL